MKNLNLRVENDSYEVMTDADIAYLFGPHFKQITCRFQRIDEERYERYRANCPYPIISMDPLYRGDYNLGISRYYKPGGVEFLGHFSRPETGESLLKQFRKIPRGSKVVIFEDDIGYGGQIRQVKKILARMDVEVVDVFTLYDNSGMEDEVLDVRDFIYGADYGGLVIFDGGRASRKPYLYPFVDVNVRCSIQEHYEFSYKMWDFNAKITDSKTLKTFCKYARSMCREQLRKIAG